MIVGQWIDGMKEFVGRRLSRCFINIIIVVLIIIIIVRLVVALCPSGRTNIVSVRLSVTHVVERNAIAVTTKMSS